MALRARTGLVQENLDGRPSSINEYRLSLNHEVSFKGGKRQELCDCQPPATPLLRLC